MGKIRVHELAREMGISSKRVMEVLEVLGLPARSHSSTLSDEIADSVRRKLRGSRAGSGLITAPAAGIRRSAAAAPARGKLSEMVRERTRTAEEGIPRIEPGRATIRRASEVAPAPEAQAADVSAAEVAVAAEVEGAVAPEVEAAVVGPATAQATPPAGAPPAGARPRRRAAGSAETLETLGVQVDFQMKRPKEEAEEEAPAAKAAAATTDAPRSAPRELTPTAARRPKTSGVKGKKDRREHAELREIREFRDMRERPDQRRGDRRRPGRPHDQAGVEVGAVIRIPDPVSVRGLADALQLDTSDILRELLTRGAPSNINASIAGAVAKAIAADLGLEVEIVEDALFAEGMEAPTEPGRRKRAEAAPVAPVQRVPRPPVVTVLGHVDHGKTKLLDRIRKTDVVADEHGGITQHIGASEIEHHGRVIVFLDTPGHQAFSAMRARGARVTDVAILVVAANEGVMPQTLEALEHAREAGVPIIVAINKMDLPDANPDRAMQQLSQRGLLPEEWGGDTVFVTVSALEGTNIPELLEMILLVADMQQLTAPVGVPAKATVIEAKRDPSRGPVATVILREGSLSVGDAVVCGAFSGKVRALISPAGRRVKAIEPGRAGEVWGLEDVPNAGDELFVVPSQREARQIAKALAEVLRPRQVIAPVGTLAGMMEQIQAGEVTDVNLVLKADVHGTLEAIMQALDALSHPEVHVRVAGFGVGAISESDVSLASAAQAAIIGFNVGVEPGVQSFARDERVDVRAYALIHELIEHVRVLMERTLKPIYEEAILGHAEVRALFKISHTGVVAGCAITDGTMKRGEYIRVKRGAEIAYQGRLDSLRHVKNDVAEMDAGRECGVSLNTWNGFHEGDIIECYTIREIQRTLAGEYIRQ